MQERAPFKARAFGLQANMTDFDLQPLIDMALVEPNLLELLLKGAPHAR